MHFSTSSPATLHRGTAEHEKKKRAPFRTAQSRRLVEEYWQSVLDSKVERPLYHTFSDRYGGTRGVPFAARTDTSAVLRGTAHDVAHAPDGETLFVWCMEASEEAMAAGDLAEARACLQQALTQLQNSDGGLTVEALASTARDASASPHGRKRSCDTGEVLRRLGKVALFSGDLLEAMTFFDGSIEADPLTSETYALRAACLERRMEPQAAFSEYEKYLKLAPPSPEVLAHCGKCAADAGNTAAAVMYLEQLLRETRAALRDDATDAARTAAAFYEAHANFYLGVVQQRVETGEAGGGRGDAAGPEATRYYRAAATNGAYVESYENNVNEAVERGDYALALYQLRCLQRMVPECADYYLRAAHVCHLCGDTGSEIEALSEALDRHQSASARRTTLLTRGTVFADVVGNLERAIKDFTLVIALQADLAGDRCTPIAYMKRAEVLRRRAAVGGGEDSEEDQEAALRDYKQFLHSLRGSHSVPDSGTHDRLAPQSSTVTGAVGEVFDEQEVCASKSVTDALLILANGAFLKRDYDEAAHFFSLAVARGWQPQRPRPFLCPREAVDASSAKLAHPEGLFDQVYLAMAHHVIGTHPLQEDMFKVVYEPRDWSGGPAAAAAATGGAVEAGACGAGGAPPSKKTGGGGAGGAKAADRKETEKATVSCPSLSYLLVDARYCALRALGPTVFSELEEAFLNVWGPFRSEVERCREDALAAKGGKRAKRHV